MGGHLQIVGQMGMALGQCNGDETACWACHGDCVVGCDGDSTKGMMRTVMGYSGGKHRATRRQLMTQERLKSSQGGKTRGRDGPQALSGHWSCSGTRGPSPQGAARSHFHRWESTHLLVLPALCFEILRCGPHQEVQKSSSM